MKRYKSKLYVTALISIGSIVLIALLRPAISSASTQYFYSLNNQVKSGMLVSLTSNPDVIAPTTYQNAKQLVGVVAPADELNINQQPGQVSVRTQGNAEALVSTLNGDIKVGDKIATSALVGVGTKLNGNGWIVGVAQGSLDASTNGAVQTTIKDSNGQNRSIVVAPIAVLIKVAYVNSTQTLNQSNALLADASKIAGKNVSLAALIFSCLMLLLGIFLSGVILNSAIRGGMLAIARQPLTKVIITREIIHAFGMAVVILISGVAGAWLILKVF